MNHVTYPAYKDSGSEWLGEIPKHWQILRLKYIANAKFSNVDKHSIEGEEPVRLCNYVDAYYNDYIHDGLDFMKATATETEIRRFSVTSGDVIITKDSEAWDDIAVAAYVPDDLDGVLCGYHLAQIRPSEGRTDGEYLFRSFCSRGINDQFRVEATGVTRFGLGKYALDNAWFVLPPFPEQRAIAAFLDRETVRIDGLIEKKQRQIELLQEKRAALISHAVTKGVWGMMNDECGMMNKDEDIHHSSLSTPHFKDSGIEWLGEIPEHWEYRRLKFLLEAMVDTEHKTVPFYPDGEYLVVRTTNVRDGHLVMSGAKYTDEAGYLEWTRRGKPLHGDILFTREAPAGEACRVPTDRECCIGQRMVLFRVKATELDDRFGVYSIYSGLASAFIKELSQGTTVVHFNMRDIGNIPMLVPSVIEQKFISDWLDEHCVQINGLIEKVEDSIALLREYRTAVISAAVTGKIKVNDE